MRLPHNTSVKEKIEHYSIPVTESGCWIWMMKINSQGYPCVCTGGNKQKLAHRVSWELKNQKKIPDGMYALHKCDTPLCVNPEHIFIGTQKDNINDCIKKGRFSRGEGHRPGGLTEDDVVKIRKSEDKIEDVASEFGVHKRTVYAIRARETWRHI